ncbi:MAG: PaaI family thioesterase [Chitinophagaceae bacterium]
MLNTNSENTFSPKEIAHAILSKDAFSQWLGIELVDIKEGFCKISMSISKHMINGFGIVHGGIAYSFADTALALACGSRNRSAVALDNTISYLKPILEGETIFAETTEIRHGKSTGIYLVHIKNPNGDTLALFKGTCFYTGKNVIH